MIHVEDDWAEDHHDVFVGDPTEPDWTNADCPGFEGISGFPAMVSDHATDPAEVIIGIETVACG